MKRVRNLVVGVVFSFFLGLVPAFAQTTISSGSIQGTVTDPSGAGVPNAKITVTSKQTGQTEKLTSSASGVYSTVALTPGNYSVRIEATNFKTAELSVVVQVGVVTPGNVRLEVGAASTTVEVQSSAVQVNTEQASVQGVLTRTQIENLPVNGRNFLDLAQLEPGVQIQDGADFDPTKVGFSSISFGGRFGRTARIEVDGVDVSDETVGTTTENIPSSAIQEFQLSQSTLDLSNELTSSGAVNVITRSGTNDFHGEGFALFRDSAFSAPLPGPPAPYARNQDGGDFGGPILKDQLFFFLDAEHINQNLTAPVITSAPLDSFTGNANAPYRETDYDARLDWHLKNGFTMFYRFTYFDSRAVSAGGLIGYQPYQDKNYTRTHVAGADFTSGGFTHSIRFEYLKFINNLGDIVAGSDLPLANYPVSINLSTFNFFSGPNFLAPQQTYQTDRQIKYDGSKLLGSHILRYGVSYNRLRGGGLFSFSEITPNVFPIGDAGEIANAAMLPGGSGNPVNYPADFVLLGNGDDCDTEIPAFGAPCSGTPPDNRLGLYIGDSWKVRPNLTVTYGVRYVRDTGRTDSDLPPLASLNALLPGLGNSVNQPNKNFGPQLGVAWDPTNSGKTVIRSGIGVFYENAIWNNAEFDRPERLANGAFLANPLACAGGTGAAVPFPTGNEYLGGADPGTASNICSSPLGTVLTSGAGDCNGITPAVCIANFQTAYQAATRAVGANEPNPNYIPNLISSASAIPLGALAPNYRTPYSVQINAGIQHQLREGMVLSVDYLRNVNLHYLIGIDANHSGDVNPKYFNLAAAQAAIATTNSQFGCPDSYSAAAINCAITSTVVDQFTGLPGASISSYANNGLDSAADLGVGNCTNALGFACAFQGVNPALGTAVFLYPGGRSVYNAMDVKLVDNVKSPFRGVKYLNFQAAYSLSRFTNCGAATTTSAGTSPASADQDFVNPSVDDRNPCGYSGPSALDRTHQISFGGYADLPLHFRLGTIFHFDSPLASALAVPPVGIGPGEIYYTDFTGDGTTGDLVPGTKQGAFMRNVSPGGLTQLINNYNSSVADQLTPAGQLLVSEGLFTAQQLGAGNGLCVNNPTGAATSSACAVAPALALPPQGEVGLTWLKTFDLSLSWVGSVNVKDKPVSFEPSVSFYNLFNFANFNIPGNVLSGILTGNPGSVNGTNYASSNVVRVGVGTGVFALGAPRTIEFGMKVSF
ncbi:MAG TPA: carboxypeptidase regulatory-like domain-containing protein [Candidatus Acidoferrum sp.]|nr:carboxypeptidase regulatory-like domain-containing protein [Candidatus Acidoferrum sp.]